MSVAAVILAGGLGTRMGPLTRNCPKPLLPVGDEPLVVHQFRRLAEVGVDDVVLATSYRAGDFAPALGDGSRWGVHLTYVTEDAPAGTGGGLRQALRSRSWDGVEAIFVLNGDLLTTHDMTAQLAAHRQAHAVATIHAFGVEDASAYGLLHTDGARITGFEEKPERGGPGLVNAGTYVVDLRIADLCGADGDVVSLEREVFPAVIRAGLPVVAHADETPFLDVGSPAALLRANLDWATRHGASALTAQAQIADDAHVADSVIMAGTRVEAGAEIRGCVIGRNVTIGAGAHLTNCVLGDGNVVEANAHLDDVTR